MLALAKPADEKNPPAYAHSHERNPHLQPQRDGDAVSGALRWRGKNMPRLRLTQLIAGRRQPKTSRFFSLVFKSPSPLLVRPAGGIKFNSPSAIKSVSLMQVAKTIFI
jgi:hypothetical protein